MLVLEAAALPFVWAVNESAALVLFAVSTERVVVGAKVKDCAAAAMERLTSAGSRKRRAEDIKVQFQMERVEAL